jgi:hypothetical protein
VVVDLEDIELDNPITRSQQFREAVEDAANSRSRRLEESIEAAARGGGGGFAGKTTY